MYLWKNCVKHNLLFDNFFLICIKITVNQSIFYDKN
jgi:hypothetical protein